MDRILDDNHGEFVVCAEDASELIAVGMVHLNVFWELREHFAEDDFPMFQLTSKGHYLMHSCLLAGFLHPHLSWAYTGEDFMGKIRGLAQSCSKRGLLWQVSGKVLQKWLVAMHLLFLDPSTWFRRMME